MQKLQKLFTVHPSSRLRSPTPCSWSHVPSLDAVQTIYLEIKLSRPISYAKRQPTQSCQRRPGSSFQPSLFDPAQSVHAQANYT